MRFVVFQKKYLASELARYKSKKAGSTSDLISRADLLIQLFEVADPGASVIGMPRARHHFAGMHELACDFAVIRTGPELTAIKLPGCSTDWREFPSAI